MNIFLTGDIQVGKTTMLKKLLAQTGLSADGFQTYWSTDGDGLRTLFLSPFGEVSEKYMIARYAGDRLRMSQDITEVFDTYGRDILSRAGRRDVIIMDELGFLESNAAGFQKTVLCLLDGEIPVLGAIKPRQTDFLDAVRARPNTAVYEVTTENRDSLPEQLLSLPPFDHTITARRDAL